MADYRNGHIEWEGWKFDYLVSGTEGLSLLNGTYQGRKLWKKLSLPVIRVKYVKDGTGIPYNPFPDGCGPYADHIQWITAEGLGAKLTDISGFPHHLVRIKRFNDQYVGIGTFEIPAANGGAATRWMEIGVYARIGEYHIYQVYYLTERMICPRVSSRGLACNLEHVHHGYWRFDLDVDGDDPQRVMVVRGDGTAGYVDLEGAYRMDGDLQTRWAVENMRTRACVWVSRTTTSQARRSAPPARFGSRTSTFASTGRAKTWRGLSTPARWSGSRKRTRTAATSCSGSSRTSSTSPRRATPTPGTASVRPCCSRASNVGRSRVNIELHLAPEKLRLLLLAQIRERDLCFPDDFKPEDFAQHKNDRTVNHLDVLAGPHDSRRRRNRRGARAGQLRRVLRRPAGRVHPAAADGLAPTLAELDAHGAQPTPNAFPDDKLHFELTMGVKAGVPLLRFRLASVESSLTSSTISSKAKIDVTMPMDLLAHLPTLGGKPVTATNAGITIDSASTVVTMRVELNGTTDTSAAWRSFFRSAPASLLGSTDDWALLIPDSELVVPPVVSTISDALSRKTDLSVISGPAGAG